MRIYPLENTVMPYAWGSVDGLGAVLGLANQGGGPQAELWMGAHPRAPSTLVLPEGRRPLDSMIASDPERMIGRAVASRFGKTLPFLFKALSAAQPLSIQVHPSRRKAERGFEKENAVGIAIDSAERNYRDPNHKPELSVALTRFKALVGFRPTEDIAGFGRVLGAGNIRKHFEGLEKRPDRMELSVFFYALMTLPPDARGELVQGAVKEAERILDEGEETPERLLAWSWVLRLSKLWPKDIGVLAPLIFNVVELDPGEAIFIAPGEPHAYLEGTALEIMANSDNVIRCALTEKHVDVAEFISVLGFDAGTQPKISSTRLQPGIERFNCDVSEFSLSRIDAASRPVFESSGPEILLCSDGQPVIRSGGESLELARGRSAFVCASAGQWSLGGAGTLWRATVGDSSLAAPGA